MSYPIRIEKVIEYIDLHLDDDLSLDVLCQVACLSKYHFHRFFTVNLGMSVFVYIQLFRFKKAAYELVFRKQRKVIDIAMSCGYQSPEAFSRAFKQVIGQTPSDFRASPNWKLWLNKYENLEMINKQKYQSEQIIFEVDIVEFKAIKIAVAEHFGDPKLIGHTIEKLIKWRKINKLPPNISRTFNLVYDDPETVQPENYRFDVGASIQSNVDKNDLGIVTKIIPNGLCAKLRVSGGDAAIAQHVRYLYSDWFENSQYELRDFPLFFERITLFPDVPEREMITDIYLPIR
ncbi:AraC family transcriptional regulator [Aliikangiella sp. IMCC44359]|uniref:AraC family transcriptional regulator n=1 Tax=Aliikangiella sp. IMCC44359 TaxID=3459125 RepID=UPI00403A81E2